MHVVSSEATVDAVVHALMSVGRLMRQRRPGDELEPGTFWLLKAIAADGPMRVTDLASRTNLDTSTVSRHIATLGRAGLVEREPDPADGRAQLVALSSRGREQLHNAFQRRRELLATALEDWTPDDLDDFHRLLATFIAAIDTTAEATRP
jgi:DNA-binding MarR family transcriptional regulator